MTVMAYSWEAMRKNYEKQGELCDRAEEILENIDFEYTNDIISSLQGAAIYLQEAYEVANDTSRPDALAATIVGILARS